jgi:hypothetical protein
MSSIAYSAALQVGNVFQNTGDRRERETECDSPHNTMAAIRHINVL